MFRAAPVLVLALLQQADPAASSDPLGDMLNQVTGPPPASAPPAWMTAPPPEAAPALPPTPVPSAAPPSTSAPSPASTPPSTAARPAPAVVEDEGEDEDAAAALPPGPQPYSSMRPAAPNRAPSRLYTTPFVRLTPRSAGALDGGWVLSRPDGTRLYGFQFNDTGGGAEIEGAWRDLRQEWASLGSGPVTSVGYDGQTATIRFMERGRSQPSVVTLRPAGAGEWSGEITGAGSPARVVMRRD